MLPIFIIIGLVTFFVFLAISGKIMEFCFDHDRNWWVMPLMFTSLLGLLILGAIFLDWVGNSLSTPV